MPRFTKATAMFTAVEGARRWARQNPDKAQGYIDKATGFVDQRTKGKYHSQIDGLSRNVKKSLTGQDGPRSAGERTQAPPPPRDKRRFPDVRA
ncbi:MAG TPA: antitoxin [Candidatus Janibacter merdipullorum]|nr:antitoxin [Candidatus Janibacter merdipullorum]